MDSFDRRDPAQTPDDDARPGADVPIRGAKSSGGGKGGGRSASSAPDTLFSNATIRIVDLLGEGEIKGVVGGLQGVYLNDVPVQNADGTFNFKGIEADFRTGTPDQPYMPGFPGVETPQDIGTTVRQAVPVTASISDEGADRARVIIEYPALFLAKNDGSVRENVVQFRIETRYSGGPWVNSLGDIQIVGKNTSPAFDTFEVDLPRNPAGTSAPWQVRVTRITPDTDPFNNAQDKWTSQSDVVFFSLTALQDEKFTYPHSALAGLKADAANFGSSVPARTYLIDAVLMPVPSNYDPEARTYTGIWDGTFKEAWSNNPAWAFHLLLQDDRFGLGQHIDVAAIDKWSLYEIGRYCDVPISDGKGGQEPRFTFNGSLYQQDDAFELLQQVAQIFRGMAYWSSGTVTATQDRPADVKALVTPANVIDDGNGGFSYASSARKARHTVAIVSWNDPSNLFKQEIEVVEDARGIARYGYNPTKIDLLGCTSRGQAYRHGLWTLLTELYETQTVTYRAGLDHAVRRPGDLIAIQDPQISNLDLGGRLRAGTTAGTLVLDREITLKAGVQYFVSVTMPDGTVLERAIAGMSGADVLSLANPLPVVPDAAAVWQISGDVLPQVFKIVSIAEVEPHIYEVVGLEHEASKYAAVDDGAAFVESPISDFPNVVLSPRNISARPSTYFELGLPRQALLLSWTAGQPFNSIAYYVTALKPNGSLVSLPRTQALSVEFLDAPSGDWQFVIQAEGLNGQLSEPVIFNYTLAGWEAQDGPTIENLQVKGGGTTFNGRSCTVEWTLAWPEGVTPYDVDYVFRVFDVGTNVLLHQEVLEAAQATYDYDENVNEGGPRRTFRVTVAARDAIGREGTPAAIVVSNPPPGAVLPTVVWTTESVGVSFTAPGDPDFSGVLIWLSKTAGFNPLATAPTFDGLATFTLLKADPDTTYYVRVACYDAFGKNPAELNISAEVSVRTTNFPIDTAAPDIPGGVVLATQLVTNATGDSSSEITATWNAVTNTNFGFYEAEILEGDPLAPTAFWREREFVNTTRVSWRNLKPGVSYSVRVRSVNSTRFGYSGWSPIVAITAAKNTTKPGAITGFTVTAAIESAALVWTNPSNTDLSHTEVWAGAANAGSPQTLLGKVKAPGGSYFDYGIKTLGSRRYWVRPVNTSDTVGDYVGPQTATVPQLQAAQLANGIIDATKFAANIAVPTTVATLPATKQGQFVTLESDGKLYRWDETAGAYTKAIAAGDITGQLVAAQLAGIEAAKITGQLTNTQIADLAAAKLTGQIQTVQIAQGAITQALFAANTQPNSIVTALPSPTGYTGPRLVLNTTDGKIYRYTGTAFVSSTAATDITGTLTDAQIAGLAATKITGTLTNAQIASLDAAKIAGTLIDAQIAAMDAAKLTGTIASARITAVAATAVTGQLTDAQVAGLSATKLTGTVPEANLASLDAAKLTGTIASARITAVSPGAITGTVGGKITSAMIDGITAAQITTQITATNIADNAITTPKISAGAVVTASLAAGAITANKLALTDTTNLVQNPTGSQGVGEGWWGNTYTIANAASGDLPANAPATTAMRLNRTTATTALTAGLDYATSPPVVAGEHFFYDAWVYSTVAGNVNMAGITRTATGSVGAGSGVGALGRDHALLANTWTRVQGDFYVGTGWTDPRGFQLRFNNMIDNSALFITNVRLFRRNGASLIVDGTITGTHVAAETIDTANLVAGSITASRLALTDLTNLVTNPDFSQGLLEGWTRKVGTVTLSNAASADLPVGCPALQAAKFVRTTAETSISTGDFGTDTALKAGFPINASEPFYAEAWAYSATASSVSLETVLRKPDGTVAGVSGVTQAVPAGAWTKIVVEQTTGSTWIGRGYLRVGNQTNSTTVWVTNIRLHRRNAAQLIVDGSIQADMLAARSITASKLFLTDGVSLIQNGDFGQGLESWTASVATAAQFSLSNAASGDLPAGAPALNAVKVGRVSAANWLYNVVGAPSQGDGSTVGFPCDVGEEFSVECWFYSSVTTGISSALYQRPAAGGSPVVGAAATVSNLAANTWQKVVLTVTANQRGRAIIMIAQANTSNSTLWVTNVRVLRRNAAQLIVDGTIVGNMVAANSIVASKLAISTSNLMPSGDLSQGLLGVNYSVDSTPGTTAYALSLVPSGGPDNLSAAMLAATGTLTANKALYILFGAANADGVFQRVTVSPGEWYEASAYPVSSTLTAARIEIVWETSAGAVVLVSAPSSIVPATSAGGSLNGRTRCFTIAQAPATAARAYVRVRFASTAAVTDPVVTASAVMLAPAVQGQTEPSPFVAPGATIINGGNIQTGSITTRLLYVGANSYNLVPLGDFADRLAGWDKTESANYIIGSGDGPTGGNYLRMDRKVVDTTSLAVTTNAYIPVEALEPYEAGIYIRGSAAGATGMRFRVLFYDANKVALTSSSVYTDVWGAVTQATTSWVHLTKQFTPPVGARYFRFQAFHHNDGALVWLDFANITIRRAVAGTLIENGAITTAKVAANAITANEIAANTITASEIAAATITGANLSAGTLTARELAAGSIVASKLAIGSIGENLCLNGDFEEFDPVTGRPVNWNAGEVAGSGGTIAGTTAGQSGRGVTLTKVSGGTNGVSVISTYMQVEPGESYEFSAHLKTDTATSAGLFMRVLWRDASGGTSGISPTTTDVWSSGAGTTAWTKRAGQVTAPVGAVRALLQFFNWMTSTGLTLSVDNVRFRRTSGATHIEDGAITTDKLTANAVTAAKIAAGTIEAAQVKAGSITGDRLAAKTITAAYIAADTITSTEIAANAITASEIAAGVITGDKLVAGTIQAREIAAGAIVASKLTLSDPSNMVLNGDFINGTFDGWNVAAGASISTAGATDPGGQWRLYSNARVAASSNWVNVTPGDELYASAMVFNNATENAVLMACFTDQAGGNVSYPVWGQTALKGQWVKLEGRLKAPANVQRVQVLLLVDKAADGGNYAYWGKVQMRRAASAQMIVDGAIITNKLAANSVAASKLAVSSANMAFNPKYDMGVRGYTHAAGWPNHTGMWVGNGWCPAGFRTLSSNSPATVAQLGSSYTDFNAYYQDNGGSNQRFPCTEGITYEVSACVSSHRCSGTLFIAWVNSAGAVITYSQSNVIAGGTHGTWVAYKLFDKCKVIAKAPAGAVSFYIILRGQPPYTGNAPEIHWSALMVAPTFEGATEASDYVDPGVTTLDGASIITGTLHANRIQANTITATQIAANTITAGQLAADSVTATQIAAGAVSTDELAANAITAAKISAGAIGTTQLAASAITADKIGVGLNSGNMLWNSDWLVGSGSDVPCFAHGANVSLPGSVYAGINASGDGWQPQGFRTVCLNCSGTPANNGIWDLYYQRPKADGGYEGYFPVAGGKRYELSGYVSAHRVRAWALLVWYGSNKDYIGETAGNIIDHFTSSGPLQNWARTAVIATSPANAAYCAPYFRTQFKGEANPYTFWTGHYFAVATAGQTAPSEWAPGSQSVIDGDSISTNSLHANRITAGTITADRIQGGTITGDKLSGSTITGDKIQGNSIVGGHIQAGAITADKIAVNSIEAKHLRVGARGISVIGCDIQIRKSDNYLSIASGYISYIDGNGNRADQPIGASGRVISGWTMIGWYVGWSNFGIWDDTQVGWYTQQTNPDFVPIAFWSGGSGLVAYYGNTIIDGERIVTGTIQAAQIAAGAINADKIGAGQITAGHIGAGQVTADKIGAGTITAGTLSLGNSRFVLEAYGGGSNYRRLYIRDDADQLRAMLGYIGDVNGGGERSQPYGLCLWDQWGTVILNGGGIHGGAIFARSIGAGSIVANTITANEITGGTLIVAEAQIGTLVVGNSRIANTAVTQTVAAGSSGAAAGVTIYVRGTGKVSIRCGRHGSPGYQQSAVTNTGNLRVYRNGGEIFAIPANYMWRWDDGAKGSYKYPLGHILLLTDEVGAGTYNYQITDDNNIGLGGVFIEVTEFSK